MQAPIHIPKITTAKLTFCDHMKRPQRKDRGKLDLSRSQSGFEITWQSNFLILDTALLHHPHFDCVSGQKKQLPELWVSCRALWCCSLLINAHIDIYALNKRAWRLLKELQKSCAKQQNCFFLLFFFPVWAVVKIWSELALGSGKTCRLGFKSTQGVVRNVLL